MGGIPPQLTREQRIENVRKASRIRSERHQLLLKVKSGEVKASDVISMDGPVARRTRVVTLVNAVPGYGRVRSAKLMRAIGIDDNRRVGGLGPRQSEALVETLG